MKKLVIAGVIGMMMLCLSGCGLLSSDKKDLEPIKNVVMETGDPDEGDPGRDD